MPFFKLLKQKVLRWLRRRRTRRRAETPTGNFRANPQYSAFVKLPPDLKRKIVSYLPASYALSLRRTSRRVQCDLALIVRPAFRILQATNWIGDRNTGGFPRIATCIPVFDGKRTHSITLQCEWWDQGWGERKGKLFIAGHAPDDDDFNIFSGRLVAESTFAKHFASDLTLSFHPVPGEIYYLWYKVGRGGHQLNVGDMHIHTIIHGQDGAAVCACCRAEGTNVFTALVE